MRRMVKLAAVAGLVMAAGCAPKAETAEQADARMSADAANARTAIEASNQQFTAHFNAGQGDSVAAHYAENGRVMAPNMPAAVGRAEIAKSMGMMGGATLVLTTQSVVASGPLAVEAGTYTIEMKVACNKRGGVFHLEFNGVDRTGPVEVPDTGGWKILKPFSKSGVTLAAGRVAMKLVLDKGGESGSVGDIDYFRFVKP